MALIGAAGAAIVLLGGAIGATPAWACGPHNQGTAHRGPDCPQQLGGTPKDGIRFLGGGGVNGLGNNAGFTDTKVCKRVEPWARPHHENDHGIPFDWYYVWAKRGTGFLFDDERDHTPIILVCPRSSDPVGVGPIQSGPDDGVSIPCPRLDGHYQTRPHESGAGWSIVSDGGLGAFHGQHHSRGGFGENRDGFWHYKWTNPTLAEFYATFYGLCKYWGETEQSRPQ